MFTYNRVFKDSLSIKHILAKSVYYQGRIYHLKTVIDSTEQPSKFISQFYDSFQPNDTLLGKDVFSDKTALFFKGVKERDTLVFDADEKISQTSTGAIGKVVDWDSSLGILYYQQERFGDYGGACARSRSTCTD